MIAHKAGVGESFINLVLLLFDMNVEEIKAMRLEQEQRVEIRVHTRSHPSVMGTVETRCGYFQRLVLPEPPRPGDSGVGPEYPILPPFVEIAYALGHNQTPTHPGHNYELEDIISITQLYTHREMEAIFRKHGSGIPRQPTV